MKPSRTAALPVPATRRPALRTLLRFLVLFAVLAPAAPARAGLLRLQATAPDGAPVELARAQVLLVAHGDSRVVDLPSSDGFVSVDLSSGWLRAEWWRSDEVLRAYLYLEAEGYAPMRSEPFHWIGSYGGGPGEVAGRAEIRFPRHRPVVVEPGERRDLTLRLRRPEERILRLVDEDGEPMAGIGVEASVFWSRANHCGALSSARFHPLGAGTTDEDGRLAVPDGDFEHAFILDLGGAPYWPAHPDTLDSLPPRVVTRLTGRETTIVLRRFRPRQVTLRVTRGGEPVGPVTLAACLARCPCGACCGGLEQGPRGLWLPGRDSPFYPEELDRVLVLDPAGEETLWTSDPREWPEGDVLRIELEPREGEPEVTPVER